MASSRRLTSGNDDSLGVDQNLRRAALETAQALLEVGDQVLRVLKAD